MQTKVEILASNPNLISYRVTLVPWGEDPDTPSIFDCYAESDAHAVEQAESAYPECTIYDIEPFKGNVEFVKVYITHHYIVPAGNDEAIDYAKDAFAEDMLNFGYEGIEVIEAPDATEADVAEFIKEYIADKELEETHETT